VTQWVESPEGGRERGPAALARAWFEAMFRPWRFFRVGVAPADQAPGLAFLMAVVAVAAGTRLALVPAARPVYLEQPAASALFVLAAFVLVVGPLALHLAAALQTVLLMAVVRERAGVSETVQVIAYATAPCVLSGAPVPAVQAFAGAYGSVLLITGLAIVHDTDPLRAALAGAPVAAAVFGGAFGGIPALSSVLAAVSV
jgi:hypothetical protein